MAQQFVNDIQAGVNDDLLQKKHLIFGRKYSLYKAAAKDFIEKDRQEKGRAARNNQRETIS